MSVVWPLPAPPVGPLAPFLLCGTLVGAARAALAPLRKHRLGGGRTAAASGRTEGSAPRPHGLAYTGSPPLPRLPPPSSSVESPQPRQASPASWCAPLNGGTRGCVSGAYGTRSHGAPGLEVWSQEGLLPATLWHQESTWLLPGKLEIPACVSAPNSKRTQLTPTLSKPFRSNGKWVKISRIGQTPQRPPHAISLRQKSLSFWGLSSSQDTFWISFNPKR